MRILHISADFPNPFAPTKTRAVSNLLELTPEFDHLVYAFVRVNWPLGIRAQEFGPGWQALRYGAPPGGIMLRSFLKPVARFILEDLPRRGATPDVVHAHKLSIDGLVGEIVADALGVPLVLSSQGNTDLRVLPAKPELRWRHRRIWRSAAQVFPFAPWTEDVLRRLLGPRDGPVDCLPCPTPEDRIIAPVETPSVLRSAFNLSTHKVKNAERLIRAAGRAAREIDRLSFEIAGGGSDADVALLKNWVARDAAGVVSLAGPMPHYEMQDFFNASAGFAMPSLRESYGMVFAEALLAGCPILHSKGFGFDGYFEDGDVSIRVASNDEAEIFEGLVRLARESAAMKSRLLALQQLGALHRFQREGIAKLYSERMRTIAEGPRAPDS